MPHKKQELQVNGLFTILTTGKAIVIIFFVGFLTHLNIIHNGFIGDDDMQILNNPVIHSLANIPRLFLQGTFYTGVLNAGGLYYKPLMSSTFTLLFVLFGPHALPFHIFQLFLFIVNAVLLFLILLYFFNPIISLFLVLVFIVHPINSENAAYISDFQDILFFFFGSIAFYLELKLKKSGKKILLVALFLLLSLFSKESGSLFIATVIGCEVFLYRKTLGYTLLASTIVLIVYGFFRVMLAHLLFQTNAVVVMQAPLATRLYSVPSVILYYLKNTLIPSDHAVLQMGLMTPQSFPIFLLSLLVITNILGALLLIGRFVYKRHRNSFQAYLLFVFIFVIGLLFHSQLLFPLDFIAADRWFYFPFVGLLGIIGVLIQAYAKKLSSLPYAARLLVVLVVLFGLSIQSVHRNTLFQNNLTLLSHDVKIQPDNATLVSNLGYTYLQNGNNNEAITYLLKAEKLDPKNAMIWNELGNYYYLTGEEDKAGDAFKNALAYDSTNYQTYQNYAIFLFLYRDPKEAEKLILQGLQLFPTNAVLWRLYSLTEYRLGAGQTALSAAKQAFAFDPNAITRAVLARLSENMALDIQVYQSDNHRLFQVCPPECMPHGDPVNQQNQVVDTVFSSSGMNLTFKFPYNLRIAQLSPQLLSISASGNTGKSSALLIYASTFSGDVNQVPLPYIQKGTIQASTALPLQSFHAQQLNYSDGTAIIVLVKNKQFIALRIPQDSRLYEQAITDIINSIALVK